MLRNNSSHELPIQTPILLAQLAFLPLPFIDIAHRNPARRIVCKVFYEQRYALRIGWEGIRDVNTHTIVTVVEGFSHLDIPVLVLQRQNTQIQIPCFVTLAAKHVRQHETGARIPPRHFRRIFFHPDLTQQTFPQHEHLMFALSVEFENLQHRLDEFQCWIVQTQMRAGEDRELIRIIILEDFAHHAGEGGCEPCGEEFALMVQQ
mmetsp:Transcript_30598/g.35294  ORF Transcript_30598/g.35294 Transcript_30598/m.35294 type:complete len:205 (+) Transcript_30598:432-1046(+)